MDKGRDGVNGTNLERERKRKRIRKRRDVCMCASVRAKENATVKARERVKT